MNHSLSKNRSARASRPVHKLLAASVLLCCAHMATAQTSTMGPMSAGQSYVGINAGQSDFSRLDSGNGLYSTSSHDTAYSLTYGNYFLAPNVGMEIGYDNFGSVSRGGGSSKAQGINISFIGKIPVGTSFNFLAKLGTTYGNTDVSSQPNSGVATGTEQGFDWAYGVGAELVINPQWSAVLQYDEHYLKFAGIDSQRVAATTLGVRMHF